MKKRILLSAVVACFFQVANAQEQNTNGSAGNEKGIDIDNIVQMTGDWFITYQDKMVKNADGTQIHTNEFVLKRSYFTLKKDLNDVFSVRYTMDLTIDDEGDDAGNVETRLKYLYVKAKPKIDSEVFTGTWIEAGMVHTPWLDYEQKVNTYRVQDNMAIERNKILKSADFGITIGGNIGPKMDKDYLKNVNSTMKGKYLSYSLGVYNGGGYAGLEYNRSKVFAGRLTFRPLANKLPELQVSVYGNVGKGNHKEGYEPDYNQILGYVAYAGKYLTLTAQMHNGVGDASGRYVDANDPSKALKNNGYNFFGEWKIKNTPVALWGRYDHFSVENQKEDVKRMIGGVAYRINKYMRLVADTEYNNEKGRDNTTYELNLEISF